MSELQISTHYLPGLVGRVTELHARYYSQHWGFGPFFEAKVATELSDYVRTYDQDRDCLFSIVVNSTIEASLAIDRSSETENIAHLRWFIVSEHLRGQGAGNKLLSAAMEFSRFRNYTGVYLWTFKGLKSAKHLYEKNGFKLTEEKEGAQWGTSVTEQKYYAAL